MKAKAHLRLTEDMKRVVNEQRLGFIASVCPDGTPNLSPKGTTAVWDDEHLVFADICSPGTIANVEQQPIVEINVVDPVARKGYRFKGPATIYTAGPFFEQALAFYRNRGTTSPIRHIVLVKVERAVPLISPAYDQGKTEDEIRDRWLRYWEALYYHRGERTTASDGGKGSNQRMVLNIHTRDLPTSPEAVGVLLDSLASTQDLLWPLDRWPAMHFDRPLQIGAVGGHGPIRYRVEWYEPGRAVLFRLTGPRGFHGTHGFEIKDGAPGMVRLEHRLCMRLSGVARLSWPLMFRWLHDALIEDALDRAEASITSQPLQERRWSLWVRFLRRVASRK